MDILDPLDGIIRLTVEFDAPPLINANNNNNNNNNNNQQPSSS